MMMMVMVPVMVVPVMTVVVMVHRLGHRGGSGRRSGFLRHGVAGEAEREHGGG
jgi:hypothetical protein